MEMTYDSFMYNGEADLLEIRLNILDEYVDKFIICEGTETFSGNPKEQYYIRDQKKFDKWREKIIHISPPIIDTKDSFVRAGFQKDYIREFLEGIAKPNDWVYYGDVDEIWKLQKTKGKLKQLAYSYYLNNRSSEDWQGTNVCQMKDLYDLNKWRANHEIIIEDGGWHFTNLLLEGTSTLLKKIQDYDHQEANIPWVKDGLQARIDANIDFLGRTHDWKGNEFKMWISEENLPDYIIKNKDMWIEKGLWKK